MCIWSIELIWVSTYGKWKKNTHSGQNSRGGTGTEQSCIGTVGVLFFYFDQCLYFSHNLVISYPI